MKIRPVGTELCPCGRTDRHDESNNRFSQFFKKTLKSERLYRICVFCYTTYSGNSLLTFRDKLLVPSARAKKCKKSKCLDFLDFFTLEDWTDMLSRNVGKELSLYLFVISQKSADLSEYTVYFRLNFSLSRVVSSSFCEVWSRSPINTGQILTWFNTVGP